MKIVNYRCPKCGADYEDYLKDTSEASETLLREDLDSHVCDCECDLVKFNYKNNCQVWKYLS